MFQRPSVRRIQRQVPRALVVLLVVVVSASSRSAAGTTPNRAPTVAATGHLIRVPLPITAAVARTVRRTIEGMLKQLGDEQATQGNSRPILVLELNPGKSAFGEGSGFAEALSLAELLTSPEVARVKTIAYLPRPIKGHGVLVAMACEELVMAPDAEIGDAGVDLPASAPIQQVVREGYRQIANLRRTIPVAVALGMLDKNLEVHKVETEVSLEFVLAKDLGSLRKRLAIQGDEVLIHRGELGWFTGREARALGFAKYLAVSRQALARQLGLPAEAVVENPLLGRTLEPRQVDVAGPITGQLAGRVQSMIDDALRSGEVNFLCLKIDSPGGSLPASLSLANYLDGLNRSAVLVVAYVPGEARADAALIALACDQLVMHPVAILGGKAPEGPRLSREEIAAARTSIRDLWAAGQAESWSLVAAFVDPDLKVYGYRNRKTGATRYFSPAELTARQDAADWQRGERINGDGQPLEVNGTRAHQLKLARAVVDNFDQFKALYGLQDNPRLIEPGWADFLIHALASPEVATLLLFLGGAAIYAELHAPGIGIGGFVASVAFLLFFWSKFLDGTSTWLEVMLFLGGVCCLLLEIFVIPGFGVFGLGGGLLVIASLVLASQTFVVPQTSAQMAQLRTSILVVAGAAFGIVAAATLLRRYAPRTPVLNRLLLSPMAKNELADLSRREAIVEFSHLVGAEGVATTQLTPSGKARFGNELLDVIADGEVIDRGCRVAVAEVHGNHIVVQQVPGPVG